MGYFPTMVLHKIIGRESITVLKRSKDVSIMDLPHISWILSLLSPPPPPSLSKPYLPASFQWIGGRLQDGTSQSSMLVSV